MLDRELPPQATQAPHAPCTVRAATRHDLPGIAVLWRQMMADHVALHEAFTLAEDAAERWRSTMHDMLQRSDSFVLLATLDGEVAGFCSGWAARNPAIYEAHHVGLISELAVSAHARRRGVGSALVARARAWFEQRALHEFQLSTSVANVAGRAFWRAVGGEELLVRYRFTL